MVRNEDEQARIIATVCQLANLGSLRPDEDIYDAGVSSIQALQLVVELESLFEIILADDEFIKARTVAELGALVRRCRDEAGVKQLA